MEVYGNGVMSGRVWQSGVRTSELDALVQTIVREAADPQQQAHHSRGMENAVLKNRRITVNCNRTWVCHMQQLSG